ncbi:MaoC family dehydratase [Ketobacter alkanivorans]|uniref:Acyl dehydratase n=1 Tax=Ketobacter alkanivorans TaxID=1917421 RepID=A0A2K9LLQ0_9GAMM|nr:MaoC family dehydratase [Ketobacter alkanivorans]AUM12405.1 acyl dehydratase [Ketobacter alkanivorans]
MTAFKNLYASELSVGDTLPEFALPITTRLVVSTAIASQDFQDVHHDKAAAQEKGTPDIFMNILSTNGFVGRYLTDWAGPGSRIKKIQFKLGAPNFPGDTMVMSGEVIDISQEGEHTLAHVNFKGKNGMGNHVSGVAVLQLAAEDGQ